MGKRRAHPVSPNAGEFPPLTLGELAAKAGAMGGPIGVSVQLNTQGADGGFGTHICDVEVDPDLGIVRVIRYTAVQDVGRAIHPSYVEGQLQGGVAQGIGFALYEKVIWENGRMQNGQMTNYIMPTSADLPLIRVYFEELGNVHGAYGAKGIGELPMDGPAPAIINAIEDALHISFRSIPLLPEDIFAALSESSTPEAVASTSRGRE